MSKWEYSIRPISFTDYEDYVIQLNEDGKEGWIFIAMIREYIGSPTPAHITHDFICRRKLKKGKAFPMKKEKKIKKQKRSKA